MLALCSLLRNKVLNIKLDYAYGFSKSTLISIELAIKRIDSLIDEMEQLSLLLGNTMVVNPPPIKAEQDQIGSESNPGESQHWWALCPECRQPKEIEGTCQNVHHILKRYSDS